MGREGGGWIGACARPRRRVRGALHARVPSLVIPRSPSDPRPPFAMSTTETTHAPVASEALPAAADLAAASAIELESEDAGVKTTLAELARSTRTVLVVFIRHFYCGSCQEYAQPFS